VVGHEDCEPQGFEEIFKAAYSLLLHQQGTSEQLRQGAATSEAALYLTPAAGAASARRPGVKKSASKVSVPVCSYIVLTSKAPSLYSNNTIPMLCCQMYVEGKARLSSCSLHPCH
jgi:hypothetical protein